MEQLTLIEFEAPDADRLVSAACTLGPDEMRTRLREWVAVRERSTEVRRVPGGVVMDLAQSESVAALADLVERESACCGFYSFTLTVDGRARQLTINAGPGRHAAVEALLSL